MSNLGSINLDYNTIQHGYFEEIKDLDSKNLSSRYEKYGEEKAKSYMTVALSVVLLATSIFCFLYVHKFFGIGVAIVGIGLGIYSYLKISAANQFMKVIEDVAKDKGYHVTNDISWFGFKGYKFGVSIS